MDTILEMRNVRKAYRKFSLNNFSLDLSPGRILGLIGPNGAGKTTTVKILMDMVKADGGEVRIFGLDHKKFIKEIKNRIGYVGEDHFFYGDKTVAWTGTFASRFYRNWDLNLFQRLMTEFALSRPKKVKALSKGMRVKLSLALALSHHPDLLILDEPTAGLDPIIRRNVLERLRCLSLEEGKSVIISSHITDDIARIADRIVFLIAGRIGLDEDKDSLLARWKRVHYLDGALPEAIASGLLMPEKHTFGRSGITDDYPALSKDLAEGIAAERIKIENVNLDDILIACVKGES